MLVYDVKVLDVTTYAVLILGIHLQYLVYLV